MNIQPFLKVFQSRKMAALILLGFSSGLPFYLTGKDPLQAWLSQEGVDLKVIAAFSVAAIPYSLKFLWSPLLDRFVPPLMGRRRGWLIISQLILLLAIGWMAFQDTSQLQQTAVNAADVCRDETFFRGFCEFRHTLQALSVSPFFIAALVVAFFSASQDIVADAYRTEVLQEYERGAGASVFLLGYRLAILVAGALTFYLAGRFQSWGIEQPWRWVYVIMALLMAIGLISSLIAPESTREVRPPETLRESVVLPFQDFIGRNGARQSLAILVFIVVYRLGDSLLRNVATPFLLDKGLKFSPDDLATPRALSIAAVIVGTLAGGAIMTRIGINRSLWFFAVLQASGNLLYVALAEVGKNFPLMILAINLENFCAGLESAAFVAFLMGLCNPGLSATQYALLSSLAAFSRDILVAPAGQWAQSMGWTAFFLLTAILALPGLFLLPFFAPWNERRAD